MRLRRKLENPMTRKFVSQFAYSHSSPKQDNRMSFRRHIFAINNNKRKTSFRTIPQQPLRREKQCHSEKGVLISTFAKDTIFKLLRATTQNLRLVWEVLPALVMIGIKKPCRTKLHDGQPPNIYIAHKREARQVLGLGAWGLGGMGVVVISGRPQETL